MLEYNGNTYELKYSIKRIEIIENAMKKPLMTVISKGHLSITELKCMIAYAAKKEGADAFMNPKVGMEIQPVISGLIAKRASKLISLPISKTYSLLDSSTNSVVSSFSEKTLSLMLS